MPKPKYTAVWVYDKHSKNIDTYINIVISLIRESSVSFSYIYLIVEGTSGSGLKKYANKGHKFTRWFSQTGRLLSFKTE